MLEKKKERKFNLSRFDFLHRVPLVEKIFFVQNLEIMARTGFSLSEALKVLQVQTEHKYFREVVGELEKDVEKGDTLSDSLKRFPSVFPELFVSMIQAGEISGKLDKTLKQLTVQMKKSHTLYLKIRNALTYPTIVFVAMLGIGTAMMIFVIPKILTLYEGTPYNIPWPTRIVLGLSNFLVNNWLLTIIIVLALVVAFVLFVSNEKGKLIFHKIILKLPIVGIILKKVNLAKMSRVFNSLLSTDISIVQSFVIISQILGNRVYRNYFLLSSERLKKGEGIGSVFKERPDLFPPVVAQMVQVGEESGTLETITEEISNFYEEEVESTMDNLTVIIEPVMMLIIGAAVGFLAVAIIYPIYGLVNQI